MVSILPGVPSFGATLGQSLGGGLSAGLGKGLDFATKLGLQKAKLGEKYKLFQKGLPSGKSESGDFSDQMQTSDETDKFKPLYSQEQIMGAAAVDPSLANTLINQNKQAYKEFSEERKYKEEKEKPVTEKQEKGKTFSNLVKKMEDLKPYVGAPIPFTKSGLAKIPYSKAAQKRKQISTLGLAFEGLFRDLTLKGQFPKAIYLRILENLPNPEDSEREYQGKLDALKDIIGEHFGSSDQKPATKSAKERPSLEEIFG